MSHRVAILDPFSGIAGDMMLGALVSVGLEAEWLRALPARLGLEGVTVSVSPVLRKHLACTKVDFDIPPQPHGRGLAEIRTILDQADIPDDVRNRAGAVFELLAEAEAGVHGSAPGEIHFHEVGAVDAILDVVGTVWGLNQLEIERVYCGAITVGEGMVDSAHGSLPVPAPATLGLLVGFPIRPGPLASGELVTPTGAALVRALSSGPPPELFVPLRSGLGAGTKELPDRANALRIVLAEEIGADHGTESVTHVTADIDDMSPEYAASLVERLRAAGALDVTLCAIAMKKGRLGQRVELLAAPADAGRLEEVLLTESTSIGVRSGTLRRRLLPRRAVDVEVLGHTVTLKVVTLPDGSERSKPEFEDVDRVATATGRRREDIFRMTLNASERLQSPGGTGDGSLNQQESH
jgi:pyridinium-3,5-bisthiocarboxylic acid mononucleotide nickel chelatase